MNFRNYVILITLAGFPQVGSSQNQLTPREKPLLSTGDKGFEIYNLFMHKSSGALTAPKKSILSPRDKFSSAKLNSHRFLVFGGRTKVDDKYECSNQGAIFDTQTVTWQKTRTPSRKTLAPGFTRHIVNLDQDKVLVWGGFSCTQSGERFNFNRTGAIFDSKQNSWKKISAPSGKIFRHVHYKSALLLEDQSVLFMNLNGKGMIYQPKIDSWSVADHPEAVAEHPKLENFTSTSISPGKLVIIGGLERSSHQVKRTLKATWNSRERTYWSTIEETQYFNSIFEFSRNTKKFTDVTSIPIHTTTRPSRPEGRFNHGAAFLDQKRILVFGGSQGTQLKRREKVTYDIYNSRSSFIYNVFSQNWEEQPILASPPGEIQNAFNLDAHRVLYFNKDLLAPRIYEYNDGKILNNFSKFSLNRNLETIDKESVEIENLDLFFYTRLTMLKKSFEPEYARLNLDFLRATIELFYESTPRERFLKVQDDFVNILRNYLNQPSDFSQKEENSIKLWLRDFSELLQHTTEYSLELHPAFFYPNHILPFLYNQFFSHESRPILHNALLMDWYQPFVHSSILSFMLEEYEDLYERIGYHGMELRNIPIDSLFFRTLLQLVYFHFDFLKKDGFKTLSPQALDLIENQLLSLRNTSFVVKKDIHVLENTIQGLKELFKRRLNRQIEYETHYLILQKIQNYVASQYLNF